MTLAGKKTPENGKVPGAAGIYPPGLAQSPKKWSYDI
jgi:hypothetical protein